MKNTIETGVPRGGDSLKDISRADHIKRGFAAQEMGVGSDDLEDEERINKNDPGLEGKGPWVDIEDAEEHDDEKEWRENLGFEKESPYVRKSHDQSTPGKIAEKEKEVWATRWKEVKEHNGLSFEDIQEMNLEYKDLNDLANHFESVKEAVRLHPQMVKERKDDIIGEEKYKEWNQARQDVVETGKSEVVDKLVTKYNLGKNMNFDRARFLAQEFARLRDNIEGVKVKNKLGKVTKFIPAEFTEKDAEGIPKNRKEAKKKWWQFKKAKKAA